MDQTERFTLMVSAGAIWVRLCRRKIIKADHKLVDRERAGAQPDVDPRHPEFLGRGTADETQDEPMNTGFQDLITHCVGRVILPCAELARAVIGIDDEEAVAFAEERAQHGSLMRMRDQQCRPGRRFWTSQSRA